MALGLTCLLLSAAVAAAATGWLDSALDPFFHGGQRPGPGAHRRRFARMAATEPRLQRPERSLRSRGGRRRAPLRLPPGGNICFDYGHHVGECRSPEEWTRELEKEPWIVRPGNRSVWFGLVDANVTSVEIEYRRGAPTDVPVSNGGFVAPIDQIREPQRLVALDAGGDEVASQSLAAEAP